MTSSIRWEPIEDLKAIREMLGRALSWPYVHLPMPKLLGVRTPVDLYETGDAFVAELDVPGLAASDLEISVTGSQLTVTGERKGLKEDEAPEGQEYVHRERPTGKFSRRLTVPGGVNVDQIHAKLGGGVLTIVMPKEAEAEKLTIEVPPESASTKK